MVKSFRDLQVYDMSYNLTLEIYKLAKNFPKEETFALSS